MRGKPRRLVHYRLPEEVLDRLVTRARRGRTSKTAVVERALRRELGMKPSRKER